MKKYSVMLLSAVFALTACNKDITPEGQSENISQKYPVFSTEMEELTKTEFGEGYSVVWTKDDYVAVFNGNTSLLQYKARNGGYTHTELEPVGESGVAGSPISANVAFYPYSSAVTCSEVEGNFTINASLAQIQKYKQNSFGAGASPMMAIASADDPRKFSFKNIFGCLKLQFTGTETVKRITVRGNNGEALCGDISVSMTADGKPVCTLNQETAQTSVILDCGEGVVLNNDAPTPFYISLPEGEYSKGITVTVELADAGKTIPDIVTGGSFTVGRSAVRPMNACKLVEVERELMAETGFTIKFCNSCYGYTKCNTVNESGTEVAQGGNKYALYGPIRNYEHSTEWWGGMGSNSPKNLISGGTDKFWMSLHGNLGTLCQNLDTYQETKFDDYDYTYSALAGAFHAFGGRRGQVSIVVDMNEICNVASIGLVNYKDETEPKGHIKSVEFYVSNDDAFVFTPANGKDRPAAEYDYSNYANPNENNWTLIARNTNLPVSVDQNEIQWVDVPYALIASGKAKGRLLKIRFLANTNKDGRTGYSARELYVKKATNID